MLFLVKEEWEGGEQEGGLGKGSGRQAQLPHGCACSFCSPADEGEQQCRSRWGGEGVDGTPLCLCFAPLESSKWRQVFRAQPDACASSQLPTRVLVLCSSGDF